MTPNEQFKHALLLRDNKEYSAAKEILLTLKSQGVSSTALLVVLGDLYSELNENEHAAREYQYATSQNPASEIASLGLFHALFRLGRDEEAFKEMRRFMGKFESNEYSRLLRDINQSD